MSPPPTESPSLLRWILGFLLVGACWGLTTPFMRRAALHNPPKPPRPFLSDPSVPALQRKVLSIWYSVVDLLSRPSYAIPLIANVTGSVWFFLLVGGAELSLTVPVTNSLAFLFTVLGEWAADGRGVGRDTWVGIGLVVGGITLCVHSKS